MGQNGQADKNNAEIKLDSEGEPVRHSSKKYLGRKIVILILFFLILIVAGYAYSLFLSGKDDNQLQNAEAIKDQEAKKAEIDRQLDSDQDKLPDYMEKILGTDENNADTDGDGYDDLAEIKNGYNPLTSEKFTEEELEGVKEVIGNEDEGLYSKVFIENILNQGEILTVGENIENWIAEYEEIMKSEPLFVKSDNPVDFEKVFFESNNMNEEIIIKRVSEIQKEELSLNNIVLFGNSATNDFINEIYKKKPVIAIFEEIEGFSLPPVMQTIYIADSIWNDSKKVVIIEFNSINNDIVYIKGKIKFEKRDNYYHVTINDDNKIYAIVWNESGSWDHDNFNGYENIKQYDGKDVEIKGYIRIANSSGITLEDSIGFLGIKRIE